MQRILHEVVLIADVLAVIQQDKRTVLVLKERSFEPLSCLAEVLLPLSFEKLKTLNSHKALVVLLDFLSDSDASVEVRVVDSASDRYLR